MKITKHVLFDKHHNHICKNQYLKFPHVQRCLCYSRKMIMIPIVLVKSTTTKKVEQKTIENVDRPVVARNNFTSFGLGAETLNLQLAPFWLFSGFSSCNNAKESNNV